MGLEMASSATALPPAWSPVPLLASPPSQADPAYGIHPPCLWDPPALPMGSTRPAYGIHPPFLWDPPALPPTSARYRERPETRRCEWGVETHLQIFFVQIMHSNFPSISTSIKRPTRGWVTALYQSGSACLQTLGEPPVSEVGHFEERRGERLSVALTHLLCRCLRLAAASISAGAEEASLMFQVLIGMANIVTSFCCVVLAAVVVVYAQRRSQQVVEVDGAWFERQRLLGRAGHGRLDSSSEMSAGWVASTEKLGAVYIPLAGCLFSSFCCVGPTDECENNQGSELCFLCCLLGPTCSRAGARIQYARIGNDVTMQCGSLDNDASVTWKVNGTDVKAQRREKGPQLTLMEVDMSSNGLYSCFQNQNPDGQRRDQITLRVGCMFSGVDDAQEVVGQRMNSAEGDMSERQSVASRTTPHSACKRAVPPKEPQVTCRSNTYPKGFYCSWHLQYPTYIPTEFDVDVQHNQKSLEVKRDEIHKNRCHVKFPELFSSFSYRVNVTAINALGRASTATSYEESSMVKPDPPEKVVARPIPNHVRRLEVTWSSPSTWPDIESFPLKYFLRYRPLIRDQWQHSLEGLAVKGGAVPKPGNDAAAQDALYSTSVEGPDWLHSLEWQVELSDSTSHTITDAYVGKEYIIQLAAKDMEIGTWSDWSVAVHATPWTEEPKPMTTTEVNVLVETTPSSAPPSAKPRVGGAMGGCSALLCSSHVLLACILLSIM
ncbi:hypothetical protein P4O66_005783, partial [Electrophorus voltai]